MSAIIAAAERAGYGMFAAALKESVYAELLEGAGPFTVFAPNDAAFAKFSTSSLDRLMKRDPELLRVVLGYHLAKGKVTAGRFAGKRIRAVMQAGGDVIIDGKAGLRVNKARVIDPDIGARNGVIHGLDSVLWPAESVADAV